MQTGQIWIWRYTQAADRPALKVRCSGRLGTRPPKESAGYLLIEKGVDLPTVFFSVEDRRGNPEEDGRMAGASTCLLKVTYESVSGKRYESIVTLTETGNQGLWIVENFEFRPL